MNLSIRKNNIMNQQWNHINIFIQWHCLEWQHFFDLLNYIITLTLPMCTVQGTYKWGIRQRFWDSASSVWQRGHRPSSFFRGQGYWRSPLSPGDCTTSCKDIQVLTIWANKYLKTLLQSPRILRLIFSSSLLKIILYQVLWRFLVHVWSIWSTINTCTCK